MSRRLRRRGGETRSERPKPRGRGERESERERERGESLEALSVWAHQRSYPEGMGGGGYYRAFEASRAMPRLVAARAEGVWKSIGPTNQGGRTLALAVDPKDSNVVWAGAASGGLWRMTMSGGKSYQWDHIDTGLPVLGVGAIAIDPRDSKVLYIGTGEVYGYGKSIGGIYIRNTRGSYGIGVLKSSDGGATWKKSLDWTQSQERGVEVLRIHPTHPDTIFAGTSEGLYRSRDAGATWEQVDKTLMVVDIAIHPMHPDVIIISAGNLGSPGVGLYRSKSGGDAGSFTRLTGGLPSTWSGKTLLAVAQSKAGTLFADVANEGASLGLYRSDDDGDSFTQVSSTNNADYQGWYSHYVRVDPKDPTHLLLAGTSFYRASDGASFSGVSGMHADHHCYADDPANSNTIYFGNDGGVYRSTDGGQSFSAMNDGYVTTQFYNGFSSSPQDPNVALGGLQDNASILYSGSPTWRGILDGDGAYTAIHPTNKNLMYGSWYYLAVSRSSDGGRNWQKITGQLDGNACFVAPFVLAPSSPSTIYGGTSYIYKSTDGGDSWNKANGGRQLNGSPILAIGVSPQDEKVVYAATVPSSSGRGALFASSDGGGSWKEITGNVPDRYYIDVVVSNKDKNTVYVTLAGYGSSHLYRSRDAGASWVDLGVGLPDVPTSAFAIDPDDENRLYVGNDLGVYVSTSGGQRWAAWKEGMPTASLVMDLSLSPSSHKIRAVTHGNGVWERELSTGDIEPPPADLGSSDLASLPPGPPIGDAGAAAHDGGGGGVNSPRPPTGGCACRLAPASPAPTGLAFAGLFLALLARPRGRSRARARTTRRARRE